MDMGNYEKMFKRQFHLLNEWLYLKHHGISFKEHAALRQCKRIGIYGMGTLGIRLIEALKAEGFEIAYGIDRSAATLFADFEVYEPTCAKIPDADLVIVTPIVYYHEIAEDMGEKINCPMMSLETLVEDLWKRSWQNDDFSSGNRT